MPYAAVVGGPRTASLVPVPAAPLGDGDVRVAVTGCGVCGSNLPVWEGRPWFAYPLAPGAPGHEGWGVVAEVGPGAALSVGDPVAFLGENAFATEVVVPAASCVVLPRDLGHFPGEAAGCAFNVAARAGFAPGQTVAVVGAGFLGAVVVALAAQAGARVVAVSRRPFALDVAKTMGATEVLPIDGDVVGAVGDITGGDLCDVVVEAVGTQAPLDLAAALTRVGGRLVIAGFHQDGRRTIDLGMWNWRGYDVVNAHERDPAVSLAGIRAAADAVAAGALDLAPLLTHTYPLDRLGDAMEAMVERPDGFLKAVVLA
jgi:threonine dehydrogenase-like Zn-dependent dehydrogenase